MNYDFDYYSGRDLHYPALPKRPKLSSVATSEEARKYANQLEVYETQMKESRQQRDEYTRSLNGRLFELKTRLRDDYDITEAQMHLLWGKAYEDGHSEGLRRVVDIFEELYEIASQFAALEKV
jgi:hypothetical protein